MTGFGLLSRVQGRLLWPRLRRIELVVCDVDGVPTDRGPHYDVDGRVLKRFDVRDGLAARIFQRAGIGLALISGGSSGAIEHRARHLGIHHCHTGVADKQLKLLDLQREMALNSEATAYLGDDLNDLVVRPITGLLVTPADAVAGLCFHADWVLRHRGGEGALREFAEALMISRSEYYSLNQSGWRDDNS